MIPEEPEVLDGSDMMVDYREVVLVSFRLVFVIDRFGFLSIEISLVLCVRSCVALRVYAYGLCSSIDQGDRLRVNGKVLSVGMNRPDPTSRCLLL